MQPSSPPKWLHLYFLLAGCLLFAVVASLYFNRRIIDIQTAAVLYNRAWAERSHRYAELGQLAAEVNLPGSDVFQSGDPDAESAKLQAALQRFEHALTKARDETKADVAEHDAIALLQGLNSIGANVEQMATDAQLVFTYFHQANDQAGQRMAAMDRQYKEVRNAIYNLGRTVSAIQARAFDKQERDATELTKWQYGLNGLIVVLMGGVVVYAVLLSRQIAGAARVADRNLVLLQESQDELRNQKGAAESANRAKSRFLANMSHEIRTPMTAIMGYADMLLEPDHTEEERREAPLVIRRSARHLLELINDILDISKIEVDKMTVERIATDIPQIVTEVASLVRPSAIAKGLNLELTFGDSVPRIIPSDPVRVRQVLMNLVGNALKFTQRGEIRLHVSTEVKDNACIVVFEVIDTGIGMSDEQMQRIFQPFTQADESTTRRFGGTGLGLTISKRLADLLGGNLTVTSRPGVGSNFRFTIDGGSTEGLEMLHGYSEALLAESSGPANHARIFLQGRILLAEDGPDNQRLISGHLRKSGAEVIVAENGRIAVALATTQRFDLILMDMQMPEMDGYTATKELRDFGYTRPIVALTAHAMAEDREKCIAAGCDDYLTKPIEKNTLLLAVSNYLAGGVPSDAGPVSSSTSREQTASLAVLKSSLADDPDMKDAIEEFVATLPKRMADISELLKAKNLAELQRVVHQLKGAGGGYGFDQVTQLACEAERAIKEQVGLETIQADIDSLIALVRSIEGYQQAHELIHA